MQVQAKEHIHFSKVGSGRWLLADDCRRRGAVEFSPTKWQRRLGKRSWSSSEELYKLVGAETVRDAAHDWIDNCKPMTTHPLEHHTTPVLEPRRQSPCEVLLQMTSVFIDDCLLAAVENAEGTLVETAAPDFREKNSFKLTHDGIQGRRSLDI